MVKVAALAPIADNLWSATTPLRFWGVETGSRMTIARLDDGGLFVHSPLPLDDGLQLEVDAMGPVEFVVAPSLFHHMAVTAWKQAYPSAVYACCPGLERKRADIAWDRVLADRPEPEWASDLDQVFFAARTMENEVVFFHRATRAMICADAMKGYWDITGTFDGNTASGDATVGWVARCSGSWNATPIE